MKQNDRKSPRNPAKRAKTPDPDHQKKLVRLLTCRSKLNAEDAALLRDVFPDIFDAHYDHVWNRLRKRGLDSQDAEDLLQEAFLTLHSHILDHGFPDSIRRMLLKITKGKLLNHVRAGRRTPLSLGLPSSRSEKPRSADLDRVLDLRELALRILPQLSPQHLDVIDKVVMNGLSYGEAADVLGISENTLKTRLLAAKRALLALAEPFLPPSQRLLP